LDCLFVGLFFTHLADSRDILEYCAPQGNHLSYFGDQVTITEEKKQIRQQMLQQRSQRAQLAPTDRPQKKPTQ